MNVVAKQQELVNFIWSVANLLRGTYRPPQYRRVMIPLIVLRRLDCVLEDSKTGIVEEFNALQARKYEAASVEKIIKQKFKVPFFNTSKYTFRSLLGDPNQLAVNLSHYIKSFSAEARAILEHFEFEKEIEKLDKANLLFKVIQAFTSADIDLHPSRVPNHQMGYVFEELVRKFNEQANEEAGDHFTPREVIRLMVHVLFQPDDAMLTKPGIVRTLYDPCCGTGGMLTLAEEYVEHFTGGARLKVYGQEYNDESFAICGSDIMIKSTEADTSHIVFGDTLGDGKTRDGFPDSKFHYMLANPPFGVEWKKEIDIVQAEHQKLGFSGRFGPGLPRINDGSLLFLLHMMSKMKPNAESEGEGCRIGIVFNGSPLFTGDAGSGESEIRRWIIENDYLEAIIALPDQMFYNTGIYTYIWIVTNRKLPHRRGKVQLINASGLSEKMKKSLGNKRNLMTDAQIDQVVKLYAHFGAEGGKSGKPSEHVRIFNNQDFAYIKLTVERPLRLNFNLDAERIQRATECSAFLGLSESKKRKDTAGIQADLEAGQALQEAIRAVLAALQAKHGDKLWKSRAAFAKIFDAAFKAAKPEALKLPAPLRKALLSALGERDETAEICREKDLPDGAPEPDPELRDTENVPYVPAQGAPFPLPVPIKYGDSPDLTELLAIVQPHCQDYLRREVLPHVPDAWVDWSKTKIGFEIPFNRHFYQYTPPRPLSEIAADIRALEADIVKLLGEVAV